MNITWLKHLYVVAYIETLLDGSHVLRYAAYTQHKDTWDEAVDSIEPFHPIVRDTILLPGRILVHIVYEGSGRYVPTGRRPMTLRILEGLAARGRLPHFARPTLKLAVLKAEQYHSA